MPGQVSSRLEIRPMTAADRDDYQAHSARYLPGSGEGGVYFTPYDYHAGELPEIADFAGFDLPLTEPRWQRWFAAVDPVVGIVGVVQLHGSTLRSGLHRCSLGIGLERDWRGQGFGEALMLTAIDFCRGEPGLDWIDLGVFSGNPRARALYEKLGFVEVGRREDCYRIGAESVTDFQMTLNVAHRSSQEIPPVG